MNSIKNNLGIFLSRIKGTKKSTLIRFTSKISPLKLSNFPHAQDLSNTFLYWSSPDRDESYLAIGEKKIIDSEIIRNLKGNSICKLIGLLSFSEDTIDEELPMVFCAKKFKEDSKEQIWDDFETNKWFIPQILFSKRGDKYFLSLFFYMNEDLESIINACEKLIELSSQTSNPILNERNNLKSEDYHNWQTIINNALEQIILGNIKKIVLARKIEYEFSENFQISSAIQSLESRYPNCVIFAYRNRNSIFFGATPEKLFSIKDGTLNTDALAGSIGRGISELEDLILENELLHSEKNLDEHADVCYFLVNKLGSFSNEINYSKQPAIKKMKNIQHLWTPINAKINPGITAAEILEELHPTPAVCGLPTTNAMNLISEYENFDRGLYSGVLGWLTEKENGEFMVALRCALLKNNKLFAYAGSGIVNGSDPISEYNETELKLNPILSLFQNEIISQS